MVALRVRISVASSNATSRASPDSLGRGCAKRRSSLDVMYGDLAADTIGDFVKPHIGFERIGPRDIIILWDLAPEQSDRGLIYPAGDGLEANGDLDVTRSKFVEKHKREPIGLALSWLVSAMTLPPDAEASSRTVLSRQLSMSRDGQKQIWFS